MSSNKQEPFVYRLCVHIADAALISLMFLLSCVPVITVPLALLAMHETVCAVFIHGESGPFKRYLQAVRERWKPALKLGAIMTVFAAAAVFARQAAVAYMDAPKLLIALYDGLLLLTLCCLLWAPPLMVRFHVGALHYIPLCVTMIGKHLFITLTSLLCVALACVVIRFCVPLAVLLPALVSYLIACMTVPKVELLAASVQEESDPASKD